MCSKRVRVFLFCSCVFVSVLANFGNVHVKELFNEFIEKFNKTYHPGDIEYYKRLTIFKETLKRIQWLNNHRSHPNSAWYGVTQFSDLTPWEFQELVNKNAAATQEEDLPLHTVQRRSVTSQNTLHVSGLPQRIDWREKNIITPVKNQEKCGACWAFSTIASIEAMYALKTGKLIEWSVQQMIDCASGDNYGCNGGDTCSAMEWLVQNKTHIVPAELYPYEDEAGTCEIVKSDKTVQLAANFTCFNLTGEEHEMVRLLATHGPLVVAVDATSWQDYLGGIIQYHCDDDRNHAVQIVGYDLTGDIPYYIVRNSWGTKFGINGYLNIAIDRNLCGIAEEVSALDII